MKQNNKRKFATGTMAFLGVSLIVGGAFAALNDTLTHNETITIEWVDIVDGSAANLALEDVSDVTNTPVEELTPGITYELTGTLENDSTVITDWSANNLTTTPGMTVTIADADGDDAHNQVGQDIDVSQFGITVQVDQTVTPSTELNFVIEFNAVDARTISPTLGQPTAISEVFPDPALAACIASDDESPAAGNVNYLISQEELSNYTYINCSGLGVTNLEGVQYLNNLITLNLENNNITDITPLANLTNLTNLYLSINNISDITPLENLVNIVNLGLYSNNISDITPLANMENLEILQLANNYITDISALSNKDNLIQLRLDNNQITDFSHLAYQPTTFYASPQDPITLPDTTLGTPTDIVIDGINGEDLIITFNTPGTYENGQLTWDNPGVNSLTYTSTDGSITGIITQTVN